MKRKKKAAEDIRQQEKLINIANMELNDKIKIKITYFTDYREAVRV